MVRHQPRYGTPGGPGTSAGGGSFGDAVPVHGRRVYVSFEVRLFTGGALRGGPSVAPGPTRAYHASPSGSLPRGSQGRLSRSGRRAGPASDVGLESGDCGECIVGFRCSGGRAGGGGWLRNRGIAGRAPVLDDSWS